MIIYIPIIAVLPGPATWGKCVWGSPTFSLMLDDWISLPGNCKPNQNTCGKRRTLQTWKILFISNTTYLEIINGDKNKKKQKEMFLNERKSQFINSTFIVRTLCKLGTH